MMYYINKIAFGLVNPLALSMLAIAVAVLLLISFDCKKGSVARRVAVGLGAFAFVWLLVFSLPITVYLTGVPLEKPYPIARAEEAPQADAIVVLGGGMASNTNTLIYAEMAQGADRVWQAARLFHAGKAPLVVASGCYELDSTKPLLLDFGIPEAAIIIENDSLNTEENAIFTERVLRERLGAERPIRVLLVTSAWHMRRSEFMFRKYAPSLEIIPCPGDYEATCCIDRPLEAKSFIPSAGALHANTDYLKEHLGYWGYRLLRK